jgi:dethiobiotin synthetase
MFLSPPSLTKPGLFITATDTGVGKTVATCAIAAALRRQGVAKVGVCKPFATGCRREREGLVSDDAEALAHFADCRATLDVINPIRYARPLAPAVAAEAAGQPPDLSELTRSLQRLDADHDVMLIEGVGGLLVPLLPDKPKVTVLDLIIALGFPVAIVCRAGLGTLNHTAMTVRLLREAGCDIAGLIVSGYVPDPGDPMIIALNAAKSTTRKSKASQPAKPADSLRADESDESQASNRVWLPRTTGVSILATLPLCPPESVAPQKGLLAEAILDAMAMTYWPDVVGRR